MRNVVQAKIVAGSNDVDLEGMEIEDHEIQDIANEIKRNCPNLKNIVLQNNKIADQGAVVLAKMLAEMTNVSFVDLQFNQLGPIGVSAIIRLRTMHPNITIALHGNKISDTGEMQRLEEENKNQYP